MRDKANRTRKAIISSLETETSLEVVPRDTNGERFHHTIEAEIMKRFAHLLPLNPFWVTLSEASFIYQSPFEELDDIPSILVPHKDCGPVRYYSASSNPKPEKFSSKTCLRYDPINFFGMPYRPLTSVFLKRYAVEHHCCHHSLWVTLQRMQSLDVSVVEPFTPLTLIINNDVYQLVNAGLTTNPVLLQSSIILSRSGRQDDTTVLSH